MKNFQMLIQAFSILLILTFISGCVATLDSENKNVALSNLSLGIIYTQDTQVAFAHTQQGNMDAQYIQKKLGQIVRPRFKTAGYYESIEEALRVNVDMLLVFDVRSFPGAFAQAGTADITGTFMDRRQQVIDYIEGSGAATLFEWGLSPALRTAFKRFARDLDTSAKLRTFAENQPKSPKYESRDAGAQDAVTGYTATPMSVIV